MAPKQPVVSSSMEKKSLKVKTPPPPPPPRVTHPSDQESASEDAGGETHSSDYESADQDLSAENAGKQRPGEKVLPVNPQSSSSESESSEEDSESEDAEKQKAVEKIIPVNPETLSSDSESSEGGSAGQQKSREKVTPENPESHSDEDEAGSKDNGKQKSGEETQPVINNDGSDSSESEAEKDSGSGTANSSPKVSNQSPVVTTKRPREPKSNQRKSKRLKREDVGMKAAAVADANVKKLFQRVWSDEDEITILKGMHRYWTKKDEDPSSDMNAFHNFIKKSVSFDCTKVQLLDKIRRLRKKYLNKFEKGELTFTIPHEREVFYLSHKIWGKSKGLKKAMEVEVGLKSPINKSLGVASLEQEILAVGLDFVGGSEKAVLQEKWKNLHIAELKLFLVRNQIVADQARSLLDYYKSTAF